MYTTSPSPTPAGRLSATRHPLLYEINIRALLGELSRLQGTRVTLHTIPDRVIDEWASFGFDALWLMGVWSTGKVGREIAATEPDLLRQYREVLGDFRPEDVIGSPYAVRSYTVAPALGGAAGLAALRRRMDRRGMGLVLDFICNHTARDHRWVTDHPEYYIQGTEGDELRRPAEFFVAKTRRGNRVIAFGRDPYFPPWTDTAQLCHFHPGLRRALVQVVTGIAGQCDGVRCDMAMLVIHDVFRRTWEASVPPPGEPGAVGEFWKEAVDAVRTDRPSFLFIAEAYWNMEWQLQQLGFDFTYDKTLYDRLLREGATAAYEHLRAEMEFQQRSLRFIENHDEVRAARALPTPAWHCAAATVISTVPGMVLYHEGQLDGRTNRIPVQLGRRPDEPVSGQLQEFYRRLLEVVADRPFRLGNWRLLHPRSAWHENVSWSNFLAFLWQMGNEARLVVVNYAPVSGQCYIEVDLSEMKGSAFEFRDLMSRAVFVRERPALESKGMYFDLPAYGLHIFDVKSVKP